MIVLGFYVLEKWIEGLFVSDGRSWSMSRIDVVVWKGERAGFGHYEGVVPYYQLANLSDQWFLGKGHLPLRPSGHLEKQMKLLR